jgi:polyhydroxyalkanoate synthase
MPAAANRWSFGEQLDQSRRGLGVILDGLGLGPVETPSRVRRLGPVTTLKTYGSGSGPADAAPLLLLPAPIKRAYIWDLAPGASVVEQCLRHGLRVYLLQWEQPGDAEQACGLAEYADRLLLEGLDAIAAETGQDHVFLAGHSLGGTLAAIFAALHPERVRGLALLEAPLHFAPDGGALERLVAVAPPATVLTSLLGNVAGTFLDLVSIAASPSSFVWARWLDWFASLPDSEARLRHLRVVRWTLDELPLAQRLFEEVVELLYRQDSFLRGTLVVSGRRAGPKQVQAPLLSVVDPRSRLVPPQSVLPFHAAASSAEAEVLWYRGDTGVALQHVGALVGRSARQEVWPAIVRWLHRHGQPNPPPRRRGAEQAPKRWCGRRPRRKAAPTRTVAAAVAGNTGRPDGLTDRRAHGLNRGQQQTGG